jgi:hypothetical protein
MVKVVKVWASGAMANVRSDASIRYMPLDPTVFDPTLEELEKAAAVMKNYKVGDLVDPSELPHKFCGEKLDTKVTDLADFFTSGPYLFASGKCADIFWRFDLAGGGFSPVEIYQGDRKTLATVEPMFLLNIRGKKSAFAANEVEIGRFSVYPGPKGPRSRYRPMMLTDDQIALKADALEGCDLWFDTDVAMTFFVSGRLAEALFKADMQGKMHLKSCRV